MPCKICGHSDTVDSHVIPKAFAQDVRGNDKHTIVASRKFSVGMRSQGGIFNPNLLCITHEAQTSAIDKYGIEFVRRIAATWKAHQGSGAVNVDNPEPPMLQRFALLTIWREIHTAQTERLTLGRYDQDVQNGLFGNGNLPDWPVIVQRTNALDKHNEPVDFNQHPFRTKLFERNSWLFTAAGVNFVVVSDSQELSSKYSTLRAETNDPAVVAISEPMPVSRLGTVTSIMDNMAKNRTASRTRFREK